MLNDLEFDLILKFEVILKFAPKQPVTETGVKLLPLGALSYQEEAKGTCRVELASQTQPRTP